MSPTDAQLLERLERHLREICETAAPPFQEALRSDLVASLWQACGLKVDVDELGDVVAELPGGEGPHVYLVAHLDTVFPAATDVRVRTLADGRLAAPGVSDNSAALAVLSVLAEEVMAGRIDKRPRLTLVASVGEEGLGDLRGARRVVADHAEAIDIWLAVDGGLGQVVTGAVGSRRLRATFRAKGGHAWGDRGAPSAIHALGDAVHAITRLEVPSDPASSLNVGEVRGGTAVNAIAEEASLLLDVRSVSPDTLALLLGRIEQRLLSVARRHGVGVELEVVGDRPAGRSADDALIELARASLLELGLSAKLAPSSTDASAAVPLGIPALAVGVARGGDAHRLSEWLDPTSMLQGLELLKVLLGRLAAADPTAAVQRQA